MSTMWAQRREELLSEALVGCQGRGCADGVQPDFCHALLPEALIFQSGDSSELAPRLPCKGKRGEKPWCLPDNALPSDTPQLAAGRLH